MPNGTLTEVEAVVGQVTRLTLALEAMAGRIADLQRQIAFLGATAEATRARAALLFSSLDGALDDPEPAEGSER